jgi:hypothetical protein
MNIPVETKPALWGAVGGAVALAIVGFSWGGWVTGGKADAAASMRVDSAVVDALVPVCVAKFRRDAAVDANLAALKKVDAWSQGDFIEKGGWATVADSKATPQMSSVARACGEFLTKA